MSRKVLAIVDDLMFAVKIDAAAKQSGVSVDYARAQAEVLDKARALPSVILVDLNHARLDVLEAVRNLKADEDLKKIPVLGFVSHVDADRRKAALEAGFDSVVPRSAFSVNLPQILKRHATAL